LLLAVDTSCGCGGVFIEYLILLTVILSLIAYIVSPKNEK